MSFAPCLCTSEACFFTSGENNAKLGVFKLNAFVLEELENADSHVAAGKVVVCAVNNAAIVDHEVKSDDERNKDKSPKSGLCKRVGCADLAEGNSVFCNGED